MKAVIRPTRADKRGNIDSVERRAFVRPPLVIKRARVALAKGILSHRKASVVPAFHADIPPDRHETGFAHAILIRELAKQIGRALPRDDGFESRWTERRDFP